MPLLHDEDIERRIWEKCQHVWTIKKFSSLETNGTAYIYTTFAPSCSSFCEWRLELDPFAKNDKHEDCIKLILSLERSVSEYEVFAKFSLSLRDFQENCIESVEFQNSFTKNESFEFPMFRRSIIKSKIITDDMLEILVEISYVAGTLESYHEIDSDPSFPDVKLMQALRSMFENGKFNDVVVLVDNKEIKAHRCVLSARSTVFSAMFDHNDSENVNRQIHITDFSGNAICMMIRFMYTGQVQIPDVSTAFELLRAADKYDLDDLKFLSADYLAWNMNATNAEEILLAAETFQCENLKVSATAYIVENVKKFSKKDQFFKIEKENPHLLTELFLETASKLANEVGNK